jgi:hypothetical protein
MKREDSKVICFYSKKSFNRKLSRYQEKVLSILETIKQDDHDKFMKEKSEYSIEELKKRIFKTYHSEIEVFRRGIADELTPHRKENHQINLILDSESSFVKNYKSMFEQELKTVKHYLDEHLEKRYIRSSSFKAVALVLLIKKSEEGLRFCVNYRALNEIIVKSRYSISIINETLTRLFKVK